MSVVASTEEGEGCERLTIFMQSRVPLGPGKFHVVVLVLFCIEKMEVSFAYHYFRQELIVCHIYHGVKSRHALTGWINVSSTKQNKLYSLAFFFLFDSSTSIDQARPGRVVGYQYTLYFPHKIPIYLKIRVKCVILNT